MQNKPNFPDTQMNVNNVLKKDYENETLGGCGKNKPNTNPKQTQSNPIKANKMPKQTQTNPISKEFPNVEVEDPAFRGRNQSQFAG
jgi:hypothetical protein